MKIVLSGSLSVDQIMNFDGSYADYIQPDKIRTLSISMLVKEFKRSPGGTAGNIAYSLALLGEKPVLYSSIGKESKEYMQSLADLGVDISHLHYSDLPTATFSVLTDKNDCQVGGFYPGAMSDAKSLTVKTFQDDDIFMVISAHDPAQMTKQAQECATYNKRMLYDVGQQSIILSKEELLIGLRSAEVLIVNDYEMGTLVKKTDLTQEEIVQFVDVAIVTLGEKGSVMYEKSTNWKPKNIPASKPLQVVDPTGAGDAFRSGFIYGYVRNWPVERASKLGSVVASFALEKHGTQEHNLSWSKIKKRYKDSYNETINENITE